VSLPGARRGSGPVLVLLHSLGTDHGMWDPVVERLAPERDVIALDMPGFGASPPIADASPPSLAAAVHAQLAEVGEYHVAGNSLGGWVALELAAAGHARSVTAIAPAGLWARALGPRRSAARAAARLVLPFARPLLRSERGRRLAFASSATHPERIPPDAARRLVRAYGTSPGFDAANDAMRSGRFTRLGEIDVPVTLAWPDGDRLVGRPPVLPPGVRSVVLRDCGHLPTWDDPDQVARVLLQGSAHSLV
jgi:pimeloyl-ACP methyl ester carboxylesterase